MTLYYIILYNVSIIIIIIFNIIIIYIIIIIIIIITIIDGDQKYIDHCPDVSQEANKGKSIKMETTINKKIQNTNWGGLNSIREV